MTLFILILFCVLAGMLMGFVGGTYWKRSSTYYWHRIDMELERNEWRNRE